MHCSNMSRMANNPLRDEGDVDSTVNECDVEMQQQQIDPESLNEQQQKIQQLENPQVKKLLLAHLSQQQHQLDESSTTPGRNFIREYSNFIVIVVNSICLLLSFGASVYFLKYQQIGVSMQYVKLCFLSAVVLLLHTAGDNQMYTWLIISISLMLFCIILEVLPHTFYYQNNYIGNSISGAPSGDTKDTGDSNNRNENNSTDNFNGAQDSNYQTDNFTLTNVQFLALIVLTASGIFGYWGSCVYIILKKTALSAYNQLEFDLLMYIPATMVVLFFSHFNDHNNNSINSSSVNSNNNNNNNGNNALMTLLDIRLMILLFTVMMKPSNKLELLLSPIFCIVILCLIIICVVSHYNESYAYSFNNNSSTGSKNNYGDISFLLTLFVYALYTMIGVLLFVQHKLSASRYEILR